MSEELKDELRRIRKQVSECTGTAPRESINVVGQLENLINALLVVGEKNLRDEFAKAALKGMLAAGPAGPNVNQKERGCREAYAWADAMLTARQEERE